MIIKMECKTCKKNQEVGLDKKTEVIYCGTCNSVVPGSYFQVQKLKLAKLWRNPPPEVKGAFFIKCGKCDKHARPRVEGEKGYCTGCGEDLNLSKFFMFGLSEYLKPNGKNS